MNQLWDTPIYTVNNQVIVELENDYDEFYIRSVDANDNQSEKSEYIGVHNLGIGANLVGVCIAPEDNSIANVMGDGVSSIIGEGIAANLINDESWVGSLTQINSGDGYWVTADEDLVHLTVGYKNEGPMEHELSNGLELISYCCSGLLELNDYMEVLYDQGITAFLGEGVAAQQLAN